MTLCRRGFSLREKPRRGARGLGKTHELWDGHQRTIKETLSVPHQRIGATNWRCLADCHSSATLPLAQRHKKRKPQHGAPGLRMGRNQGWHAATNKARELGWICRRGRRPKPTPENGKPRRSGRHQRFSIVERTSPTPRSYYNVAPASVS
jgi:hypothetical protein